MHIQINIYNNIMAILDSIHVVKHNHLTEDMEVYKRPEVKAPNVLCSEHTGKVENFML